LDRRGRLRSQLFNIAARRGAENAHVSVPSDAGEQCPTCGAALAPDQRYCLECGHRRGDPRLPFMDAVVFMDAVQKSKEPVPAAPPQAQQDRRPLISANASLVAGVATLVLAIGVGVLIGRSGEGGSGNVAATPPIIKVGGGEEEAGAGAEEETAGADKSKDSAKPASKKTAKAKTEEGSSGTSKAAEDVLEPAAGVKLPPPTTQLGDKCEEGTEGCDGGEFNGNFFE
jgi:hypothetical protein